MLNLCMAMSIWATVAAWLSHPSLTGKEIVFWLTSGVFFPLLDKQASDHSGLTA